MAYFFKDHKFHIEDYDQQKTFSSFLPGVSGLKGIPIWSFYVNRGQGIASFGTKDKSSPILEFSPANISYQKVLTQGFRTFLKINGVYVEPFSVGVENVKREMRIDESSFEIEEINSKLGYKITVKYFGLPNENLAALVRRVKIESLSETPILVEGVDGSDMILPTGITNDAYKAVGNLMRSWMDVFNLENKIGFYRMRASSADQAELVESFDGNFYLSLVNGVLTSPIVDNDVLFGYDTSLLIPENFVHSSYEDVVSTQQITANKVPCGFTPFKETLEHHQVVSIDTMIGYASDMDVINKESNRLCSKGYFDTKEKEAYDVIRTLTNDIESHTNYELFDEYARQSYLDNFVRGGYPIQIADKVYHVYSRKHGDLERDYNWFTIAPEYYSQGNGAYRDANQNRRNESFFKSFVKDYNIKMFMNLVQLDGYNPLSVNGTTFELKDISKLDEYMKEFFPEEEPGFKKILAGKYTPGQIAFYLGIHETPSKISHDEILNRIMMDSIENLEANYGEGYWVDHWTYNYDLIENYLSIYPEEEQNLLFNDAHYRYFNSPVTVLPRSEKYVLNKKGQVRQYGSINHKDHSKEARLGVSPYATNFLRTKDTKEIYETNLFEKLMSLTSIKLSTLDPYGIGIEMESEKPGWNDACNGLPGLFGSGVGETMELLRVFRYLQEVVDNYSDTTILISKEVHHFIESLTKILKKKREAETADFEYWDEATGLREKYRKEIGDYISGEKVSVQVKEYQDFIDMAIRKCEDGLEKAKVIGEGVYPTFLTYEVTKYELVKDENGHEVMSHYGLPKVIVHGFKVKPVVPFLEGPARAMKILSKEAAHEEYELVKKTDLLDKKLMIYQTSVSLDDESFEIGRVRAFTPGWLERESCFLHMIYKYVLGLLKAECYEDFYEAMKTNLVCFRDPSQYGRSTLENCSFLATSGNPDPNTHGRGFQSRLTGANTELLNIWSIMMFGAHPFTMSSEGKLELEFKPALKADFFDENNQVQAKFLSTIMVTYINPKRVDTYKAEIQRMELEYQGKWIEVQGSVLDETWAKLLRDGSVKNVKAFY